MNRPLHSVLLQGFYNPLQGQANEDACISCPANAGTAGPGSGSINDCVCNAGYYNAGADNASTPIECKICPLGTYCSFTGSTLRNLTLQPGWWRVNVESEKVCMLPDDLIA